MKLTNNKILIDNEFHQSKKFYSSIYCQNIQLLKLVLVTLRLPWPTVTGSFTQILAVPLYCNWTGSISIVWKAESRPEPDGGRACCFECNASLCMSEWQTYFMTLCMQMQHHSNELCLIQFYLASTAYLCSSLLSCLSPSHDGDHNNTGPLSPDHSGVGVWSPRGWEVWWLRHCGHGAPWGQHVQSEVRLT